MNKKIIGLVICTLLIAILVPTTTLSTEIKSKNPSNNLSINDSYEQKLLEIQKGIKGKNANWTAGYTTVFGPNAEFNRVAAELSMKNSLKMKIHLLNFQGQYHLNGTGEMLTEKIG